MQAPKLSDTDVEQARVMIQMGIPKAEVARTFGVSRQTLYASLARGATTLPGVPQWERPTPYQ